MNLCCCLCLHKRMHYSHSLLLGIILGFVITSQLRYMFLQRQSKCPSHFRNISPLKLVESQNANVLKNLNISNLSDDKKLIFVGVMTAQKYLDTRAQAIHNTWGQQVPGRLLFFSSANSKTNSPISLLRLPTVDDSYPPQRKSFLMLKFMHDHFLDTFEWFMRADDDVYIRTDRLEKFLRSVNSSKPQFIGQAGVGNKKEFGQLSLEPDENFCMGGPGMIMSRDTLRLVIPHIRYCLKNLYSTHEDVEVGRCIRKFVGIPCTWSYEMQSIFYHSFSGEEVFTGRLKTKEVHRAITLHPIKKPIYMYRLHNYFQGLEMQNLRHNSIELYRELLDMKELLGNYKQQNDAEQVLKVNVSLLGVKPLLNKLSPANSDDILTWDFVYKSIYSANNLNPKRRLETYRQMALNDAIMEVMETINQYSKQRGRVIEFKEILYGYVRQNPLFGVEYILDMLLTYKKYRGKKMTVPVRRHAYLQRPFSQPEFQEVYSQNSDIDIDALKEYVNIIVPLSGRADTLRRFLRNLEEICLQTSEKIRLAVVVFTNSSDIESAGDIMILMDDMKVRYRTYDLRLIEASGAFSRAKALEIGARSFSLDSLLFFLDVDIILSPGVLDRVRLNTVQGIRVYYPIVFSEYNPEYMDLESEPVMLSDERGYWRQFGYGIASIYHSDLRAVGGLDTSIEGWGKEDVDLFSKVIRANLTVFRTADPGIVHLFHPISCSPELETLQFEMCWGTKLSSLASQKRLAHIILSNRNKYLNGER